MLQLDKLDSVKQKRKRVGRGGSRGGQSGRGHKGQRSRSGGQRELRPFFEGGQMPLSRRLPRRGFTNVFKKIYTVISVGSLSLRFVDGDNVTIESLQKKGLIKGKHCNLVKILGSEKLDKKLIVTAHAFSRSAVAAIERAGGTSKEIGCGSIAS
jgi:large subunit ribosomal protein L15